VNANAIENENRAEVKEKEWAWAWAISKFRVFQGESIYQIGRDSVNLILEFFFKTDVVSKYVKKLKLFSNIIFNDKIFFNLK